MIIYTLKYRVRQISFVIVLTKNTQNSSSNLFAVIQKYIILFMHTDFLDKNIQLCQSQQIFA